MSEKHTRVKASQIADIRPADITAYATNEPTDNYIPSYDEATGKWTWVENTGGTSAHSIVDSDYHTDKADYIDAPQSPTILSGGVLSEGTNAGTFKVSALTALIRTDTTDVAALKKITLAEQDNQAITLADTAYFVCLDYNSDTPQITISTTRPNGQTIISIGQILKDGDDVIHYLNSGNRLVSGVHKLHVRAADLRNTEIASGMTIADEGSKQFSIAEGIIYKGINRFTFAGLDTSLSANVFTYVYYANLPVDDWVYVPDQTEINVDKYNSLISGTGLADCNKYKCDWVFVHPDDGHIYVVYGQDNLNLAGISDSKVPTLPDLIDTFGILIGRIIIEGTVATFERIEMIQNITFNPQVVIDHNDNSNIQGGTTDEYYHLTSADYTELTEWLDNVTLGNDGKLTLPSGVAINEFSSDGTLDGNSDLAVPTEKAVKTYVDNNAGDTLPIVDTTGIAKGSVDATKIVRLEVDGLTTETTRVLTVQDKDYTIADNADLHTQNTDTDLDATFEATFVKKVDTVNVLSDITSTGAEIEDAVTHKDLTNNPHEVAVEDLDLASGTVAADIDDAVTKKHAINTDTQYATIGITIDGSGVVLTTGYKGFIRIPYACTITKATLLSDISGSIVIDLWKCSYADYDAGSAHPVDGDSITSAAPPTISTATKSEDSTLTDWTTSITAGDVIGFNIDSVSTITKATLIIEVTKA